MIDQVAPEDHFRWDGRACPTRVQSEQAQIDLREAIDGLQSAQLQNALPQTVKRSAGNSRQLHCEVGFHGRTHVGWAFRVDVESTIGQLTFEDRTGGLVDLGFVGGGPLAAGIRRRKPQLQQHPIRLERGVSGKLRAPVTLVALERREERSGAPGSFRAARHQHIGNLETRTHHAEGEEATAVNRTKELSRPEGSEKRTSSSLISISVTVP